jgi:hypothetical protein
MSNSEYYSTGFLWPKTKVSTVGLKYSNQLVNDIIEELWNAENTTNTKMFDNLSQDKIWNQKTFYKTFKDFAKAVTEKYQKNRATIHTVGGPRGFRHGFVEKINSSTQHTIVREELHRNEQNNR